MAAVKGTLSRIKLQIGMHHVMRLLELLTECQERDVMVTVLGMAVCKRVVELSFLQVCDILRDHTGNAAFHVKYMGTLAVRMYRQTHSARKGMHARVSLAENAAWDPCGLLPGSAG